jgi:hypothetical protein
MNRIAMLRSFSISFFIFFTYGHWIHRVNPFNFIKNKLFGQRNRKTVGDFASADPTIGFQVRYVAFHEYHSSRHFS